MFRQLIVFCFFVQIFADCPGNGIEWQTKCYYFITNSSPFITADLDCIKQGGHLASVHDGFTNAFIGQEGFLQIHDNRTSDIWIGGTSYMSPGNWSWTDGSNFTFSLLKNSTAVPSESCTGLSLSNGAWSVDNCVKEKPYVCEINNVQNPTKPSISTTSTKATFTTTTPLTTTTIAALPKTTTLAPSCPLNWSYYDITKSCYFYTTEMDWSSAEEYCQIFGGHLASIHSDMEYAYVYSLSPGYPWIGFYSNGNKAVWQWTDGTVVDYMKWYPHFPQNSNNLCVALFASAFYNGYDCSSPNYAVCKKSAFLHQ